MKKKCKIFVIKQFILVLGDFFHIVPVGDSCLFKDIVGAKLFTKFKLLKLNDEVRASEDETHLQK